MQQMYNAPDLAFYLFIKGGIQQKKKNVHEARKNLVQDCRK